MAGVAEASWRLNPFSGKQDFYLGGGAGDNATFGEITTMGTGERITGNTYGNYLDFNDNADIITISPTIALINATAPASPTASGVTGQLAFDGTYWYVCVASNTWMRTQLSTWAVVLYPVYWQGGNVTWQGVDVYR